MAAIEAIATTYLEADAASVTFSSIPSTFEHLQLRASHRGSQASTGFSFHAQLNSDTGTNYTEHRILAYSGTGKLAQAYTGQDALDLGTATGTSNPSTEYVSLLVDFLDYANTNKYTTVRNCNGKVVTSSTDMVFGSGLWLNTAAVTTIKVYFNLGNIARGSEFTLYGLNSS